MKAHTARYFQQASMERIRENRSLVICHALGNESGTPVHKVTSRPCKIIKSVQKFLKLISFIQEAAGRYNKEIRIQNRETSVLNLCFLGSTIIW